MSGNSSPAAAKFENFLIIAQAHRTPSLLPLSLGGSSALTRLHPKLLVLIASGSLIVVVIGVMYLGV